MPRSVLVVEDYSDLRAAIVDVLSRNGCVCDSAEAGAAIEKLRENRYEAIFVAPTLPIGSDPVLSYLVTHQPNELAHVVVMTNPSDEAETFDSRCGVLEKPFSSDQLLTVLRKNE
jgi:CheY-like chemotaxis protein